MDDVTGSAAEDAVELVLAAGDRVAELSPLAETVKLAAVIPAPGLLAEVSAYGALVPELRTCHFGGGLRERRIGLLNDFILCNLRDRSESAYRQAAVSGL